ncbi:MAG: DUF3800 domain-containing protein [Gammaproteobacteria bacterium]
MDAEFSDYIVYVDESGDHSLESIDPKYPIFVLAFCIFNKHEYANDVTTAIQKFKFNHFGHDIVLLHELDIRKARKEFVMLVNQEKRHIFMAGLNQLISESSFTVISVVIEKKLLKEKYAGPANPYYLALCFGLERIYSFLREKQQAEHRTHIIFENRGKKEDKDLELEFRRVCDGRNRWGALPFDIILADKKTNSCGL